MRHSSFLRCILFALALNRADAQQSEPHTDGFVVDSIAAEAEDIFEGRNPWPILGPAMDFFHARTRDDILREEIWIQPGDTITPHDINELQNRLRALGAFAEINPELDTAGQVSAELPIGTLRVRTRDTWSILLYAAYTRSQDETAYALSITDYNLLGSLNRLGVGTDYSSLGNRGHRYFGTYRNANLYGTFHLLDASVTVGDHEASFIFQIARPVLTDRFRNAYSVSASSFDGRRLVFPHRVRRSGSIDVPLQTQDAHAWFSRTNGGRGDVFRWGISSYYDHTIRDTLTEFARAFENSVGLFAGIASHRRRFAFIRDADFNGERQIPIGAYGSVSVGKISPHSGGTENMIYIGFDAGKSVIAGDLYANVDIAAGTGFQNRQTGFTTLRWDVSAAWMFNPGALVARLDQSTVWNWTRYLAAFESGGLLRGYDRETIASDNKLAAVIEYRLNPIVRIIAFDLGAVAFLETGGFWNQGELFGSTRFHSAAGVGLRVGYAGSDFGKGILRIDLAWNLDQERWSKLLIGTEEAFDVFGTLAYRPPGPYTY